MKKQNWGYIEYISLLHNNMKIILHGTTWCINITNNRTLTTKNQQRKGKTIAMTHPVFSRFDLFDPRRDVLWRSGPGSVSGTRTCCSSDRACACWLPVGWLGRPWQPVSVWWECWQELPFSPPLTFGKGVSFFPSSPLLVSLLRLLKIKNRITKKRQNKDYSVTENPPQGRSGSKWVISREFGARLPLETNRKRFKFTCSPVWKHSEQKLDNNRAAKKCYSHNTSDGSLTLVPTHVSHQDYIAKELNLDNSSEEQLS